MLNLRIADITNLKHTSLSQFKESYLNMCLATWVGKLEHFIEPDIFLASSSLKFQINTLSISNECWWHHIQIEKQIMFYA